jgi:hypothetical protein
MKLSEQVDKILPALAAIQSEVEIKKNKTGHNYKYADLRAVYQSLDEQLQANGLVVVQTLDDTVAQADQVLIITRIYHIESGQWIESRLAMISKNPDPQGLGSAITYGRRYSLLTVFGLCPEDDDAKTAMPQQPGKVGQQPAKKPEAGTTSTTLNNKKSSSPDKSGSTSPTATSQGGKETNKNPQVRDLANLIVEACKLACLTPQQVSEITGLPSIKETVEKGDAAALAQAWNKVQAYLVKKGAA